MPEARKLSKEEQFESLFNDLITRSYLTSDVTVGNVTFTLKTLQSGEILEAESIQFTGPNKVPYDINVRLRVINTLSYAIVSVNGIPVEDSLNSNKEEVIKTRNTLHKLLMKLPPAAVDTLYNEYLDLVNKQNESITEFGKNIENF